MKPHSELWLWLLLAAFIGAVLGTIVYLAHTGY